jgi:hypothetical protein
MKRLITIVAAAIAVFVYVKRPVRQPAATGNWDPADHERASHEP